MSISGQNNLNNSSHIMSGLYGLKRLFKKKDKINAAEVPNQIFESTQGSIMDAVRSCVEKREISRAVALLNSHQNEDLLVDLIAVNKEPLPLSLKDLEGKSVNDQKWTLIRNNHVEFALDVYRQELLSYSINEYLVDRICSTAKKSLTLPWVRCSYDRQYLFYTLQQQHYFEPVIHKENFEILQLSEHFSAGGHKRSLLCSFFPYFNSLLDEIPEEQNATSIRPMLEKAYDAFVADVFVGYGPELFHSKVSEALQTPLLCEYGFEVAMNDFTERNLRALDSLDVGETMVLFYQMKLPEGVHLVGLLFERVGHNEYYVTFCDSAEDLPSLFLGRLDEQHSDLRRLIRPFLTIAVNSQQLKNQALFDDLFKIFHKKIVLTSRKAYLERITQCMGIDTIAKVYVPRCMRRYAIQRGETCQSKVLIMIFKGMIDKHQPGSSKGVMKKVKERSLLRFSECIDKGRDFLGDAEAQKFLVEATQKHKNRQ